jgi:hypothetical protein
VWSYLVVWTIGRSVSAAAHRRPVLSPISILSTLLCSGTIRYFQDVAYWNTQTSGMWPYRRGWTWVTVLHNRALGQKNDQFGASLGAYVSAVTGEDLGSVPSIANCVEFMWEHKAGCSRSACVHTCHLTITLTSHTVRFIALMLYTVSFSLL